MAQCLSDSANDHFAITFDIVSSNPDHKHMSALYLKACHSMIPAVKGQWKTQLTLKSINGLLYMFEIK